MIPELEQSVIGAILLSPDTLSLLPSIEIAHFVSFPAQETWTAIRNLEARNQPIDATTLGDEIIRKRQENASPLQNKHDREQAAARVWAYLGECALRVPTVSNAIEYAKRLKDHALTRRLLDVAIEIQEHAQQGDMTGEELLSMAMSGMSMLDAEQPAQTKTIGDVIKRRMQQLDEIAKERATGQRSLSGYPTGIARLDEKIGGWQQGIVSIVAARPGMGKSSLGLATADACSNQGFGVHVLSLEDTESAYADRTMARTSGVSAESIRNCELSAVQMQDMQIHVPKVTRRKQWLFDDRSGITAQEIVRSVRRHKRENQTRVVIVDYVQLVARSTHQRKMSTHEVLTENVTVLADAAKQDKLAYVVMSQLNREIEKREDRRPQLADLRESGSLEERAKCVVGVYRGAAYQGKPKKGIDYPKDWREPTQEEFESTVQLLVLKNSNGRTGTVRAKWHGATTRME